MKKIKRIFKNIEARVKVSTTLFLVIILILSSLFVLLPIQVLADDSDWTWLATHTGASDAVQSIDFSEDGVYYACGAKDDSVRIYWVSNYTLAYTIDNAVATDNSVNSLDFSPNNKWLAVSGDASATSNQCKIYDYGTWAFNASLAGGGSGTGYYGRHVDFSHDNTYVMFGAKDSSARIFWTSNWTLAETLTVDAGVCQAVAWSTDDYYVSIASQASPYQVKFYWTSNWTHVKNITVDASILYIAWSEYNNSYMGFSYSNKVQIVDNATLTNSSLITLASETYAYCPIFSKDGNWLGIGGGAVNNDCYIYEVPSWVENASLDNASDRVLCVAFSVDSSIMAFGSLDNDVWVYDTPSEPADIASSFTLSGLDGNSRITWSGEAGEAVWSNATSYGTLNTNHNVNASDNCTEVRVYMDNLSNDIFAQNVTIYVSSNDTDYAVLNYNPGNGVGVFPTNGGNMSINETTWPSSGAGTNPFPIDGAGWTNGTIYCRFILDIPNGVSAGTYTQDDWKTWWKVVA